MTRVAIHFGLEVGRGEQQHIRNKMGRYIKLVKLGMVITKRGLNKGPLGRAGEKPHIATCFEQWAVKEEGNARRKPKCSNELEKVEE